MIRIDRPGDLSVSPHPGPDSIARYVPAAKVFDRIAAPKIPPDPPFMAIYKVVSPDGIEPSTY
jgi:hypothetical protein